jgi:hypothetical protein
MLPKYVATDDRHPKVTERERGSNKMYGEEKREEVDCGL